MDTCDTLSHLITIWITLIVLKIMGDLTWDWLTVLLFPVSVTILLALGMIIFVIVLFLLVLILTQILSLIGIKL